VSKVDPNGGYINMSAEGQSQRQAFMNQLAVDKSLQHGRFSFAFLSKNYDADVEELAAKYFGHEALAYAFGGMYGQTEAWGTEDKFLQGLLEINNKYLGVGLSVDYLSSGVTYITSTAIVNNNDLVGQLLVQCGDYVKHMNLSTWDDGANAASMSAFNAWSKEGRDEFKEKNEATRAQAAAFNAEMKTWDDKHNFKSSAGGVCSTSTVNPNNLLFGIGGSGGIGVGAQAIDISAGILLNPKPGVYVGQIYFSIGTPIVSKNDVLPYFNASLSGQALFGTYDGIRFDARENGRTISGGSALSASYSNGFNKNFTKKSSSIWGIGPSAGIKYSGGAVKTYTWAIDFFLWFPSMRIW
jgi:hypothetical protein